MEEKKQIGFFERYLTVWVIICIVAGIGLGSQLYDQIQGLSEMSLYGVNIPVAILIWLMIYPMMVQIDFSAIKDAGQQFKGLSLTFVANWLVKPFSMAFFAWLFFDNLYSAWLSPEQAQEYIAGAILLGAAPCTAMVFVWSYLSDGDANYTLVQVAVNDLILLIAFVPIVGFLLGVTNIEIPYDTLVTSVVVFVVIPLVAGFITNRLLIKSKGETWFKEVFLAKLKPVSIVALLSTLVLLFAFQGKTILENPFNILLIAIPLALQTYFIFFITWFGGKKCLKLNYKITAPSAMIGASNFFELAVAVAIALFGLNSGAALATVVGVLIEVPIMLHLVSMAKKWQYRSEKK
ncbi:arsenical-resistance protein (plasmid) [Fulvitalea axinellae]|uniref:Arsenical-resistance protein n=1 Tax=Fulvitalea axinellae TaxID=1182444 RepID=A0AAU9CRR4_9BACT|nr:arsenical-resistance protein [Fulvitalea axinellae]